MKECFYWELYNIIDVFVIDGGFFLMCKNLMDVKEGDRYLLYWKDFLVYSKIYIFFFMFFFVIVLIVENIINFI